MVSPRRPGRWALTPRAKRNDGTYWSLVGSHAHKGLHIVRWSLAGYQAGIRGLVFQRHIMELDLQKARYQVCFLGQK